MTKVGKGQYLMHQIKVNDTWIIPVTCSVHKLLGSCWKNCHYEDSTLLLKHNIHYHFHCSEKFSFHWHEMNGDLSCSFVLLDFWWRDRPNCSQSHQWRIQVWYSTGIASWWFPLLVNSSVNLLKSASWNGKHVPQIIIIIVGLVWMLIY